MTKNILIIGCGKMGGAMLEGWLNSEKCKDYNFYVIEPYGFEALNEKFANNTKKPKIYKSKDDLIEKNIDAVMLAVKPQVVEDVIAGYSNIFESKPLLISIIAGKNTAFFEKFLNKDNAVVRVMPNLPATISQGFTALFANKNVNEDQKTLSSNLMESIGEIAWVEKEEDIDKITAISGSGPAYQFYFMECLQEAALKLGLSKDLAEKLVMQTCLGASMLTKESLGKFSFSDLRTQVTSPNGTTQAALDILMDKNGKDGNLEEIVNGAVKNALKRAIELSS